MQSYLSWLVMVPEPQCSWLDWNRVNLCTHLGVSQREGDSGLQSQGLHGDPGRDFAPQSGLELDDLRAVVRLIVAVFHDIRY